MQSYTGNHGGEVGGGGVSLLLGGLSCKENCLTGWTVLQAKLYYSWVHCPVLWGGGGGGGGNLIIQKYTSHY